MSKIKSLADQLRDRIRGDNEIGSSEIPVAFGKPATVLSRIGVSGEQLKAFFDPIEEYEMDGTEKILIRLDKKTINLLRQMKLAKNIDMTKVIVFSLSHFLSQYPWLGEYIKQTLNNTEI